VCISDLVLYIYFSIARRHQFDQNQWHVMVEVFNSAFYAHVDACLLQTKSSQRSSHLCVGYSSYITIVCKIKLSERNIYFVYNRNMWTINKYKGLKSERGIGYLAHCLTLWGHLSIWRDDSDPFCPSRW